MDFEPTAWSCSFCGKRGAADTRYAAGLGALMCTECLTMFSEAFAAPENVNQRVIGWTDDSMSDADMLARLPLIAGTAGQVDRYLRMWVARIRERHISYAEIGKALGVSRQAAWERFSRVVDVAKDGSKASSQDGSQDGTKDGTKDAVDKLRV